MKWGAYCETFGATPRNRIMEVFLTGRSLEFSQEDIVEETTLPKVVVASMMAKITKKGHVIATRALKGKQLYRLNKEHKDVKLFLKAYDAILHTIVEEYNEKIVA